MAIKIGLAGNPNCGKTTMFNNLTGAKQYVGNWPGVTVEKKVGKLKGHANVEIVDLPGIYSLSPYTLEEVVTRNFMFDEKPDAIINIIDASINKVTNEFEEKYKNRISFYGNDLLLNIFDYINVKDASYSINKDYNFEILKEELSEAINRKNLNYKVVLVFDKNFELSNKQYNEIITMLSNYKLYVVLVDNIDIDKSKIRTIDFYKEIKNHPEYLMKDRVHLTNDGNKRLNELIIENLK